MFQTMADFTPLAIMVVGVGQVGVVAWGIYVMRNAGRERAKQMELVMRGIERLLERSS